MNKYEMNIDKQNNPENINININIYENSKDTQKDNNIQKIPSKNIQLNHKDSLTDEDENDNMACLEKCCFYSCCCCLCNSREKSKNYFRKGWRDYLIKEGTDDESNKPFRLLTNLFVNEEDAISALESIRLNPN